MAAAAFQTTETNQQIDKSDIRLVFPPFPRPPARVEGQALSPEDLVPVTISEILAITETITRVSAALATPRRALATLGPRDVRDKVPDQRHQQRPRRRRGGGCGCCCRCCGCITRYELSQQVLVALQPARHLPTLASCGDQRL